MKYLLIGFIIHLTIQVSYQDKICQDQKSVIDKSFKKANPVSNFTFSHDSHKSIFLTWIGENSGKMLIISLNPFKMFGFIVQNLFIYLSENNGKHFKNVTTDVSKKPIFVMPSNLLQMNHYFKDAIYIIAVHGNVNTKLYYTLDGAVTWKSSELSFKITGDITFHPNNKMRLLTLASDKKLYLSKDGGATWKMIKANVDTYKWLENPKNDDSIIVLTSKPSILRSGIIGILLNQLLHQRSTKVLEISEDGGSNFRVVKKRVKAVYAGGKFVYISVVVRGTIRKLLVSTDFCKTFRSVYLPSVVNTRFYSILDITDDMVLIHVDGEKNNGNGILYTSDSDGRVFSQSLRNHFMPPTYLNNMVEFYKVESMRGVYITSQLNKDNSISSLITFNKGAEWKRIRKPTNEPCHNSKQTDCSLQVSGSFSKSSSVMTHLPLSTKTALGVIMIHGHLSKNKKTSKPDVFISSDGGYNWIKSLSGPHKYQISDHGGLLVAVPDSTTANVLKFSTDEGRCWHTHVFTAPHHKLQIYKILTEPGNKAMSVSLWAFNHVSKEWVIYVLDLSLLLSRECSDSDYETWLPHSEMMHPSGKKYAGCLLGKKETFLRLKKDSLCKNGYSHESKKNEINCPCTTDDYECEYGYFRPINSMKCIRNNMIKEDLCVKGVIEKIITNGYKKIPGDTCEGGFTPAKTQQKMIKETCKEINESWKKTNGKSSEIDSKTNKTEILSGSNPNNTNTASMSEKKKSQGSSLKMIFGISIPILLVGCFIFLLIQRYRNVRNREANLRYRIISGIRGGNDDKSLAEEELDLCDAETGDNDDTALLNHASTGNMTRGGYGGNYKRDSCDSDVEIIN